MWPFLDLTRLSLFRPLVKGARLVVEQLRKAKKCTQMKIAFAEQAEILFFVIKYTGSFRSRGGRRDHCLSSIVCGFHVGMIGGRNQQISHWLLLFVHQLFYIT